MSTINIFLSYKMPRLDDNASDKIDIAKEFAAELYDHSGGQIAAHCAGNFEHGRDWRAELIETIKMCDIFILLYTGSDQQWEFCLLEAGLFQATHPERPLVVLHDPTTERPEALANLNAVYVTIRTVADFLEPIFKIIMPKISQSKLDEIATELVRIFHADSANATNFDLVPSFTLEMSATASNREQLRSGKIPDSTRIRGTHEWQVLFDKGTGNQMLKWSDLTNWPVRKFYDFKFARMSYTALSKDTPGGCFIRPSMQGKSGSLYRVALRRYEESSNNTGWKFFFTAAPIDIPIFGIDDNINNDRGRAYHLLNVCWYTRRRLIEDLANEAEIIASSTSPNSDRKDEIVWKIQDEIVSIDIQSFIRKIDQPLALGKILPLKEIQDDQSKWIKGVSVINSYQAGSDDKFIEIIKTLEMMKTMNTKYSIASAVAFAASVSDGSF